MVEKMKCQDPDVRVKNFEEVELGFTKEQAEREASRCLNCKNPKCVEGCPVNVNIPAFIQKIKEGDIDSARSILLDYNNLPGICGRVCPQENQCQKNCVLGIKGDSVMIGKLERYASDHGKRKTEKLTGTSTTTSIETSGEKSADFSTSSSTDLSIGSSKTSFISSLKKKKVAVIGSGPAGLTCAADLAKIGVQVTVFEAFHKPGGVLTYGIPAFRLPKSIIKDEVKNIEELGVKIKYNTIVGKTIPLEDIKKEYDAIFLGVGAGLPKFLGIEGENLNGVISANEFLTRVNLMKAYKFPDYETPVKNSKKTVVIGGGNVAMDAARCARRIGAEVTIVYRRSFEEMPARNEEIEHAKEEGIIFRNLTNPVKVNGEGKITSLTCIEMNLGEEDSSGRRRPVPKKDSEFEIECDQFIVAIGRSPNPLLTKNSGIEITDRGNMIVDDKQMTSKENIFAGGDIARGETTVIEAMGDGKRAAAEIIRMFEN